MSHVLLTVDDIKKWRSRLRELSALSREIAREEADIARKLEAAEVLFGDLPVELREDSGPRASSDTKSGGDRPTWPSEMMRVFNERRGPMTFEMVREAIDEGPLKGEYHKSDKGFYHAASRLQERGFLAKHRGWLFRTEDLERHKNEVRAGTRKELDDASTGPNRRSPMGESVKEFLIANPSGVTSADVIAHLKKDERFAETLNKNATGAYNVIGRLAKRKEIIKEGRRLFPLKENEPPTGGSDAGGASTSPNLPGRGNHGDPAGLFS